MHRALERICDRDAEWRPVLGDLASRGLARFDAKGLSDAVSSRYEAAADAVVSGVQGAVCEHPRARCALRTVGVLGPTA